MLQALHDLRADLGSSRPPGRLDGTQFVIEGRAGVRSQRGQISQFAASAEDFIEPAGNLR